MLWSPIEDAQDEHPGDSGLRRPHGTRLPFGNASGALFYIERGQLKVGAGQ